MSDHELFEKLQPINIRYKPYLGKAQEQRSLPLKLLVMGDFSSGNNANALTQRKALEITPHNFDARLKEHNIKLRLSVPNRLTDEAGARMAVTLEINSLDDFEPDQIVQQVEPLRHLLNMRRILERLKMQYLNEESFRKQLDQLATDPDAARAFVRAIEQRNDK